jgi:hypothetical protein
VDEASVAEVADDRPRQLQDLLFGVVLQQAIEQLLVDVGMVDDDPFSIAEGGLLRLGEALLISPGANAPGRLLVEDLPSR